MSPNYSCIVDYGGTWTRISLLDSKAKLLRSKKIPSVSLSRLHSSLKTILSKFKKIALNHLVIGARGVWSRNERRILFQRVKDLAIHVTIMSDVELARRAVFGKSPGILILAGTGSIAFGRNHRGQSARAGGLGPEKGDQGSGYWMGKTWLKRTNGSFKRSPSLRNQAAMAERIIKNAGQGDRLSRKIVMESFNHLSGLVVSTAKKLHLKEPFRVGYSGGLFKDATFRSEFFKILKSRMKGVQFKIHRPPAEAQRTKNILLNQV